MSLSPTIWPLSRRATEQLQREAWEEAQRRLTAGQVGTRAARPVPATWQARLRAFFPDHLWFDFSAAHADLMTWENVIELESTPPPFVAVWPRGRGKSTFAEITSSDLGARGKRRYILYVSETQDQADKHVATIAAMLESNHIQQYYPDVGRPRVGRNGSRRWNRQILRAANGLVVEAVGLDKAMRGHKVDWARPDLIVLDDIDGKHDTEFATSKKIATLTTSILPAGAPNCAVLFVQNLIHAHSIATRLSKPPGAAGAADFLANRVISGPHKAVDNLTYVFRLIPHFYYKFKRVTHFRRAHPLHWRTRKTRRGEWRWVITSGTSPWTGFDLRLCEDEINRDGPQAFDLESQHEVDADRPGSLLKRDILEAVRVMSAPALYRLGVAVDPSGGAGQCGIVGGGLGYLGKASHGFTLADYSTPEGTPSSEWARAVLRCYYALQADFVIVEDNFGGDMVRNTIRSVKLLDEAENVLVDGALVKIVTAHASRGKEVRAEPVATLFQTGVWHHVGHFPFLEKQWTQWIPGTKPSPDRLDAEVWLATYLMLAQKGIKVLE